MTSSKSILLYAIHKLCLKAKILLEHGDKEKDIEKDIHPFDVAQIFKRKNGYLMNNQIFWESSASSLESSASSLESSALLLKSASEINFPDIEISEVLTEQSVYGVNSARYRTPICLYTPNLDVLNVSLDNQVHLKPYKAQIVLEKVRTDLIEYIRSNQIQKDFIRERTTVEEGEL